MKILFINRLFTLTILGREPLGVLYLSSALKSAGHKADLVDAGCFGQVLKMIHSFQPDLLAYPIIRTGFHRFYLSLNRKIQQKQRITTIWGGPHPTFFPQMIEEEGVDYICRGEGEKAFCELADCLQRGGPTDKVDNFWIKKEDGRIIKNPLRPLIPDLDLIPLPDRELLYRYPSWKRFPVKSFIASRGCSYQCSYCFNPPLRELYGNPRNFVRHRSVDNLISEITLVKERYPLQFIQFEDDIFPLEVRWLREFSLKYSSLIGLPFTINARPELIKAETITSLKKAGCHSINLGLETGEPQLRGRILNRPITDEQILKACRMIRSQGLKLLLEVMVGLPESQLADDMATLQLARRCQPDYCIASLFQPYPGTLITREAGFRKRYPGFDYNRLNSFYASSPLDLPQKREVENLMRLFALAVSPRLPLPWLQKVIRYPLGRLYSFFFIIAKFLYAKRRVVPVNLTVSDYLFNLKRVFHL